METMLMSSEVMETRTLSLLALSRDSVLIDRR
jgi:hypothetical protein